jgi:hypothetical protein
MAVSTQPVNPDIFGEQSKPSLFRKSRQEMTCTTGLGLMPIDRHFNVKYGQLTVYEMSHLPTSVGGVFELLKQCID